jgi:nicotinate phosphoribosyltransferase
MHGSDAGIKQPRAFYIAGVDSTSSVLAGQVWGIPVSGTMAHSYILAFPDELAAFRQFVRTYPRSILLIDTFSVEKGIQNVISLMREIGGESHVTGVRLDSGDLVQQAFAVRQKLDTAGLHDVKIYASSSLDEYEIEKIVDASVPIDGFGVGRNMASSFDVPVLDTVYKLTQYAGQPRMKFSESKSTLPGQKQVFRERSAHGLVRDVVALVDETGIAGEPLLVKVMENGRRTEPAEALESCRDRCRAEVAALPLHLWELSRTSPDYRVEVSSGLAKTIDTIRKNL